jgi:hypothetical protein
MHPDIDGNQAKAMSKQSTFVALDQPLQQSHQLADDQLASSFFVHGTAEAQYCALPLRIPAIYIATTELSPALRSDATCWLLA